MIGWKDEFRRARSPQPRKGQAAGVRHRHDNLEPPVSTRQPRTARIFQCFAAPIHTEHDVSDIFDTIRAALDSGTVQNIAYQIGSDPSTTQRAITAALPMMLGGMARHTNAGGAREVQAAITSPEAQQAATTVTQPNVSPPPSTTGLLSALLGQNHGPVQQHVAQASGLNPQQAGKLLLYLAPIVVGVLARRQQATAPAAGSAPAAAGGLSALLHEAEGAAQQHATQTAPELGQVLTGLFH